MNTVKTMFLSRFRYRPIPVPLLLGNGDYPPLPFLDYRNMTVYDRYPPLLNVTYRYLPLPTVTFFYWSYV